MYTGCGFVRDESNCVCRDLVAQSRISENVNIPGSSGVDLGPRKEDEPGGNEAFPQYHALVSSRMWLSGITRWDIVK